MTGSLKIFNLPYKSVKTNYLPDSSYVKWLKEEK